MNQLENLTCRESKQVPETCEKSRYTRKSNGTPLSTGLILPTHICISINAFACLVEQWLQRCILRSVHPYCLYIATSYLVTALDKIPRLRTFIQNSNKLLQKINDKYLLIGQHCVTCWGGLLKLFSLCFSWGGGNNQWNCTVLAHSLCKPLATGNHASKLCFPKGWQLLIIVQGCFYLRATNCKLPLYPGGLASMTMPNHLRPLIFPPKQQVTHTDNLFTAAKKIKQGSK